MMAAMRWIVLTFPLMVVAPLPVAASPDTPVRVTTESPAYCKELSVRVASQPGREAEQVRSLAEEGQRLCETGHVRTGIAKLRRALRASQGGS
jgi:hypothetical protein